MTRQNLFTPHLTFKKKMILNSGLDFRNTIHQPVKTTSFFLPIFSNFLKMMFHRKSSIFPRENRQSKVLTFCKESFYPQNFFSKLHVTAIKVGKIYSLSDSVMHIYSSFKSESLFLVSFYLLRYASSTITNSSL